ncbi:MAG: glycosyltransferase family 2 protein [Gammaproteobacteria bacterium]
MSATVSAVVVNYNAGTILGDLIRSLIAQDLITHVVVVDNASSDGSLQRLENEVRDPRLRLVRNADNRGFAAACNQGAALVDSHYLLFINPDCRMDTGALSQLLAVLRDDPCAGMAGPLILNADGSEQRGCRRYLPDPRRALMRVLGFGKPDAQGKVAGFDLTGTPLPSGPTEVEAISGACMLLKREVYAKLGGWDEGYFLHCEDLDLCMRLRSVGMRTLFVPDARVTHVQGVSSRGRKVFVLWHKHRGMWRYFTKFQRAASPVWLTALVWFGIWSRFLMLLPDAWLASLRPRHHAA